MKGHTRSRLKSLLHSKVSCQHNHDAVLLIIPQALTLTPNSPHFPSSLPIKLLARALDPEITAATKRLYVTPGLHQYGLAVFVIAHIMTTSLFWIHDSKALLGGAGLIQPVQHFPGAAAQAGHGSEAGAARQPRCAALVAQPARIQAHGSVLFCV